MRSVGRSSLRKLILDMISIFSEDETYTKWSQKLTFQLTDSKCPPPKLGRFDSICAVDGFNSTSNVCADNPCTGSADCFPLSESEFHCLCHPGYEKNEAGVCAQLPEVNECEMENNCSEFADCIDTLHSKGSAYQKKHFNTVR